MIIVEIVLVALMGVFWIIGILLYPFKWICESMFLSVDALWITMNGLQK